VGRPLHTRCYRRPQLSRVRCVRSARRTSASRVAHARARGETGFEGRAAGSWSVSCSGECQVHARPASAGGVRPTRNWRRKVCGAASLSGVFRVNSQRHDENRHARPVRTSGMWDEERPGSRRTAGARLCLEGGRMKDERKATCLHFILHPSAFHLLRCLFVLVEAARARAVELGGGEAYRQRLRRVGEGERAAARGLDFGDERVLPLPESHDRAALV
jgi:hypothetical protein